MSNSKSSSKGGAIYLFCIGGTGSRVLKALTFLLASGCKLKGFSSVVPIIIDPDNDNGNLSDTKRLINLYRILWQQIETDEGFFHHEIKSSRKQIVGEQVEYDQNDFQWQLEYVKDKNFEKYIDFESLNQDDQNFIRLFYSQKNLNTSLDVGFKGSPNMGVIVLDEIMKSGQFNESFIKDFNKDEDAIFIISSIFGGTGAAGLPLILERIQDSIKSGEPKLKDAKVGAISFLPYFSLNKINEIDSGIFDEKTKIALGYYNSTIIRKNKLNVIYYVGNKQSDNYYEYAVGGNDQKNNANFLEMAGALSVFDFCSLLQSGYNGKVIIKNFGINKDDRRNLRLSDLCKSDHDLIKPHVSKFKIFADYLTDNEGEGLSRALNISRWTKDKIFTLSSSVFKRSNLTKSFFSGTEFGQMKEFLELFNEWLRQMEDNNPNFAFFPTKNRKNALEILGDMDFSNDRGFKQLDQMNNKSISKKIVRKSEEVHSSQTTLVKLFHHSLTKLTPKR